jgi:FHS family glucose/mannose:H+ symporter-like MFS transporter
MAKQTALSSGRAMQGRLLLYLGFAATGVGVVMPGALLPALLRFWKLNDSQAGSLFLAIIIGSAIGSLVVGGILRRLILRSSAMLCLSALALAFWPHWLAIFCFLWGFGLGMLMTSITLTMRSLTVTPMTELVRLNLLWAAGAFICPVMMTHALRVNRPDGVLSGFALFFALYTLALGFAETPGAAVPAMSFRLEDLTASLRQVPFALLLAMALAPGIESAAGAWLATYAARTHHMLSLTVRAPTYLWLGLLTSRALAFLPRAEEILRRSFVPLLLCVAASALTLSASHGQDALLLAAGGIGFGLGPLYPILLARVLDYSPSGAVFFLAGVAAAILPWLTGLVSYATGSLQMGLALPAAASVLLLVLGWRLRQVQLTDGITYTSLGTETATNPGHTSTSPVVETSSVESTHR